MENLTFWLRRVWVCCVIWCVGFSCQTLLASSSLTSTINYSQAGTDPVIFTFNCFDGQPGDTVCIQVTVQNFTDIAGGQFEIIWDSDVLEYIRVQNPGTNGININGDFNQSGPNALKFIPLGFPITGVTLPDGTVLFEICFRIVGLPGSMSPVGISPFFEFEIANDIGVIPSEFVSCTTTVSDAVDLVGFVTSCGPAILGGNGDIDLSVYGGTAPYGITWLETVSGTPGGPIMIGVEGGSTVINAPLGNYDIIITDAVGASVTYNIDIVSLALSVVTRIRQTTCYKFDNGTIRIIPVGGAAPYSYIWQSMTDPTVAGSGFIRMGDSSLVTSLPDGIYLIHLEDANGCEAEITAVLNDNPFIITVNNLQDATCNGSEDGLISITVTGATPDPDGNYTITLKPTFVVVTNSVTVGLLDPGDYCITIQDEISQCDTVFCYTIGSATTITGTVTPTNVSCAGGVDGRISLRGLTNGVSNANYSYWIYKNGLLETNANNVGGVFNYSPLAPGDYMAIIREGACTSDSILFTISEPPPIVVTLDGSRPDNCIPTPTGDVWFNISGGMGPYMLASSAGTQDGDTLLNLNSGNYTLTVTDAKGCMKTLPFRVYDGDDNEEIDISFQINGIPCEPGSTVTVLYQGGPVPAGAGILWSTGATMPTIPIDGPDTLDVDLIFGSPVFCILDDTVIINCEKKLELDISVINPICNDEAVGGPYTG
nr:cohesin domain-containing protein [Bacteroidota bacterium]